jgi:dTDP-glucose pyrophosphorylase/CBS domain-containing protein
MPPDSPDRLERAIIAPEQPISAAVARLEHAETGILLLCREDGRLVGVLTDGDIRRAILSAEPFDRPCADIASRSPVTGPPDLTALEALRLMDQGTSFPVDHLPLVDAGGRAVGLLLRRDLVALAPSSVAAVIMAGGFGSRLKPLTDHVPKPMLPVGDKPLLELTIDRLRDAGIRRVSITTHHLAEQITHHFGNGDGFGIDVAYVAEEQPLGTAGALRLMADASVPVLVINGDILTRVDFRDMVAYHRQHRATATIGVTRHEVTVPYGVVESDGPRVRRMQEKPRLGFLVNAGIYILEPGVQRYIPAGCRFDMTQLIDCLLAAHEPVVMFPIVESWLDIGCPDDYQRAQRLAVQPYV